jgi:hypothetical protein
MRSLIRLALGLGGGIKADETGVEGVAEDAIAAAIRFAVGRRSYRGGSDMMRGHNRKNTYCDQLK